MKTPAVKHGQFVTDAKGKRIGVVLDLQTYEHLREVEQELADIQAYDSHRGQVYSEIAAGQFSTLSAYRGSRGRKGK